MDKPVVRLNSVDVNDHKASGWLSLTIPRGFPQSCDKASEQRLLLSFCKTDRTFLSEHGKGTLSNAFTSEHTNFDLKFSSALSGGGRRRARDEIHSPNMGSTTDRDRVKDRFSVLPGQHLCKFVSACLAFVCSAYAYIVEHVKTPCSVSLTT